MRDAMRVNLFLRRHLGSLEGAYLPHLLRNFNSRFKSRLLPQGCYPLPFAFAFGRLLRRSLASFISLCW